MWCVLFSRVGMTVFVFFSFAFGDELQPKNDIFILTSCWLLWLFKQPSKKQNTITDITQKWKVKKINLRKQRGCFGFNTLLIWHILKVSILSRFATTGEFLYAGSHIKFEKKFSKNISFKNLKCTTRKYINTKRVLSVFNLDALGYLSHLLKSIF